MSRAPTGQPPNGPVAVLHRVGGSIRAVIGTLGPAGRPDAPAEGQPALTEFKEFRSNRPDEITAWLDEHDAGSVVVVLPSASVVCRTCTLPDADPEHLAQALALQAEAHLLTAVPDHRRAMAVLPAAAGEMSRSGVIVDWPEGPGDQDLGGAADADSKPWGERPVTYAPDVAAIAALLNGHRPDEPLLWFDRGDGSLALAIGHANGAILRAARVGAEDAEIWSDSVGRVIAETALSVGHTPTFTETLVATVSGRILSADRNAALVVPRQTVGILRGRIGGTPEDLRWWRDYGVAVGALVAATGQLAALTRLRLSPPLEHPSSARRVLGVLSDPASALRIAVVCALIVLLAPLIFSGLRLGLLKVELPDLETYCAEARQAEVQLAMYRELENKAWPMTKLLSDLACCTPEGIDLEQIRVGEDRVRVSGRAKPEPKSNLSAQQVVTLMQQNLRDSRIFDEIYPTWGDPDNFGHYEFTLSAKVAAPYRRHDYSVDLDYGLWTRRDRLYGGPRPDPEAPAPGAEPEADTVPVVTTAPPPAETEPAPPPADADADTQPADDRPGREMARPRGRDDPRRPTPDGPLSRGTDRPVGGSLPASKDVPPPLTAEQIEAMSLPEAQETYARISRALQQARVDKETKERLWRDWRLIRDHVRNLKKKQ
ncbi:MAG: hypothetical protein ACYSW1_06795 [Planctomycetota bacterium]